MNRHNSRTVANDPQWYDANGNPIAETYTTDANGKKIPAQTPYDRDGNPLKFDESGNRLYQQTTSGYSSRSHSSGFFPSLWYGSGYRSGYYGGSRSSGGSSSGSTYFGGSKPNTTPKPSSGGSSSGSVSRGGFGSMGSVFGGSSS